MDGVTQVVLESFGVKSFEELWALPMSEVVARMDEVSAHGGDKALAVIVLKGVVELREATAAVARTAEETDAKTNKLVRAAWLTLAVAAVTLVATIVIAIASS